MTDRIDAATTKTRRAVAQLEAAASLVRAEYDATYTHFIDWQNLVDAIRHARSAAENMGGGSR